MSEIKKGDRVRISGADSNCGFWVPDMYDNVGKKGIVIDVVVVGESLTSVLVDFNDSWDFHYPPSVVELVKEEEDDE